MTDRTALRAPAIPPLRGESLVTKIPDEHPARVAAPQAPVDCIFGTAVLSTTRMLAVFYWAQSRGHNKPLILLDFTCEPLTAESWQITKLRLGDLLTERRTRTPRPLGLWVEGEALMQQAFYSDIDARLIPPHLGRPEAWHPICQAAAGHLASGSIGYTPRAQAALDARPFLNAAGVFAGPRSEDPLIPAFLYGIIIGLDEVLARDPHPRPPVRGRGQGS
jgi:hypothetical protein